MSKSKTDKTDKVEVAEENALQTIEAPAMPVSSVEIQNTSVSGEISRADLQVPTLKLAQRVGELGELFPPGTFVLNNEHALSDGKEEIKLVVGHWNKYYLENLEYGTDQMPRSAKTLAEVAELEGTTEWIDGVPPTWVPIGVATCIIEGEDESHFPFEYNDKRYAMALWTMRNTAYKRAGRVIMTAAAYNLKQGLEYGAWNLTSALTTLGKNKVYVPSIKTSGRNDEEFADFVRQLVR
tara:strand:- start:5192 stop:5905 length:714 start_codon:yes stop_codon:yes gene_type:complete